MRALALLALVAFASEAQDYRGRFGRTNSRCVGGRSDRGFSCDESYAFFEFAPTNGRGMTAACACTTPSGAKGEALTFTRTGAATCSKQGLATTGIGNGDLVVCANNNEPRVEPSGGVLGLRVESARTNSILRSQELDNGSWALASGGAPNPGNPVITANAATAPDGTATADRVDFASTTGTGFGVVYNALGRVSTAASWSHSIYVKGVSGSGTIYLMSTPGGSYNSTACAFVSTSWSRCSFTGTETAATWYTQIGFDLRDGTQSGQGAQSVYLWGVQGEAGAYATSYIPTVAASATRNVESPTFSLGSGSWGCESASFSVAGYRASGNNQRVLGLIVDAINTYDHFINFSGASLQHFTYLSASVRQHATSNAPAAAGGVSRAVFRQNGTTLVTELDGTTTTTTPSAYTPLTGASTLHLGRYTSAGGYELDGIVSRVQVDPSSSRCSP